MMVLYNIFVHLGTLTKNMRKKMTADNFQKHFQSNECSPNVSLIRSEGYRIIQGTIPRTVRTELLQGVKAGHLGRLKGKRLTPEVFYHPDFESVAIDAQLNKFNEAVKTLSKIIC